MFGHEEVCHARQVRCEWMEGPNSDKSGQVLTALRGLGRLLKLVNLHPYLPIIAKVGLSYGRGTGRLLEPHTWSCPNSWL